MGRPTVVMYLVGSTVKMKPEECFSVALWILLCDCFHVLKDSTGKVCLRHTWLDEGLSLPQY